MPSGSRTSLRRWATPTANRQTSDAASSLRAQMSGKYSFVVKQEDASPFPGVWDVDECRYDSAIGQPKR
jgi:hypothetical protein